MGIDRIDSQKLVFPQEIGRSRSTERSRPEAGMEAPGGRPTSFTRALGEAIGDVNQLQNISAEKVEAFVRGEDVPLHEVVLAQEEAEISFRLLLETRNRLLRAYQEVLRTPM